MTIRSRDLRLDEQRLIDRREQWLQENGWKRTCHTPGSYWLWQKTFDRWGEFKCSLDTATSIQEASESAG